MARSSSSLTSEDPAEAFIATLNLGAIETLALQARLNDKFEDRPLEERSSLPSNLSCTIHSPPEYGSYNVVYELTFSDGAHWALRIPYEEWNSIRATSMRLDILAQQYISSHTSVPIPHIHAYSCTTENALGHPYLITDFARGARLVDVWNDPSWWTGARRKERMFASLSRYMSELGSLEFDKIGRLDRVEPGGPYFIAPFPSRVALNDALDGPDGEMGPFSNLHEYLGTLLAERRKRYDSPRLAALSILLGSLPDPRYDSAPFIFNHPDFDSQNIFVDEGTAEVSAMIDWDGVAVVPRQLGALTYPAWITVDWDPIMYRLYKQKPHYDTEDDLHGYRTMYTALSQAQADVTRNSHVVSAIACAITEEHTTADIVHHLFNFVFGSSMFEALMGLENAPWYNIGLLDIARVTESHWNYFQNGDDSNEYNSADGEGEKDRGTGEDP
ncbi:hypothetical protein NEOLEDRAFT_1179522 [Neolentinus lepideus HHB14362 ss-1]|uniref:Aminoglycoside phosphotransferase domain-containing protein n=1 Tax=Neolentinus lepideus HHB14362 ss-1 TaxID=1314782 RepID=A0A165RU95_9AGAM|nr:hypothetical protein NEOLEDRAFT_1179522 [Neolentinus lepideus HHB14362 ss-1]